MSYREFIVYLEKIRVKNFRLLHDVELFLEEGTTVIVGRNNSGKTSLTEVMKRLLAEKPSFRLEDFSFCAHEQFWNVFISVKKGEDELEIRKKLPYIETQLVFSYLEDEMLGVLGELIVDLDPDCTQALAVVEYTLKAGKSNELFADLDNINENTKPDFFKAIKERVPALYEITCYAVDPNDVENRKIIDMSTLRKICGANFISAQRGLDDTSQKEQVVIGKVLEGMFVAAKTNPSDEDGHKIVLDLEGAVKNIQEDISNDFNQKLNLLLPALSIFGYPGLSDPKLLTETTLDIQRLLVNHTKMRYTGINGVHLPEAYNGLGARNIILMLLQIREFFTFYLAVTPRPTTHVIFIEEPEAHLHPQMQEVFIRKLGEIAKAFSEEKGVLWPVQFIVSTHSSHIANEAHFETIRYFLATTDIDSGTCKTLVKDLRSGLSNKPKSDRDFLHKYMTLTRCNLFFADSAILIEGTSERLLLPNIFKVIDKTQLIGEKLESKYISIIEVGGAYAHIFFDLLKFLELRTLIITDIDSINNTKHACQVKNGERTSNECIIRWFNNREVTPAQLVIEKEAKKIQGKLRIAYQVPEENNGPCGRSFEDAFMIANPSLFELAGLSLDKVEEQAWEQAKKLKKTDFALTYALEKNDWIVPRYIREGLVWLAASDDCII